MTQKIKVKSMSQNNNRKKIQKQNWNMVAEDTSLLDSILKYSNPSKNSKTKLNTTMAVYNKNVNFLPSTVSNREVHNQSHNSRGGNKKDLSYMKQMMNKTVLIQNQDYTSLGPHISGIRHNIGPRMELKKKSTLVVPKQVMMVKLQIKSSRGRKIRLNNQQQKLRQAYNQMHSNIKKFEAKERTFERIPPKRHSSYEDRIKGDSVSKRVDPRLYVTQRN